MLGGRVKCSEKDMRLLSSLSVWASVLILYHAAIYWQQSSMRCLLKLFVDEWHSCFECSSLLEVRKWERVAKQPPQYIHGMTWLRRSIPNFTVLGWVVGSCSWPADVGLLEGPAGHLLQVACASNWLETEALMALVGWRLSPDGHLIKSSLAGQKLFMLLSPQVGAKLGETCQ